MTLPLSGAISLSDVNIELGKSATATISLNDADVRALFGVPSGSISMSDGYGKSSTFFATISSSQSNLNLRTFALANGWNGTSYAVITIASGVYIWSNSTAVSALTINGVWPNGVKLINLGYIMGMGGAGAGGFPTAGSELPTPGGPAIALGVSVEIDNTSPNAYIGGGGGGAGSSRAGGGGGAGGGAGGRGRLSDPTSAAGGGGGAIGQVGGNGAQSAPGVQGGKGGGAGGGGGGGAAPTTAAGGGGGGRIFPGTGGAGGTPAPNPGGPGGASNASGTPRSNPAGAGGGGWGASGGSNPASPSPARRVGGTGGSSVTLNGFSVSWTSGNTTRVWGSVS